MRLWHKDLIDVLPRKQLLAQWRECCAIARNIAVNGTPNHILVNRIMDYPPEEFFAYAKLVYQEMLKRGYSCGFDLFAKWFPNCKLEVEVDPLEIFTHWHNKRYFWQCFANLEEKCDCGAISEEDWDKIENRAKQVIIGA